MKGIVSLSGGKDSVYAAYLAMQMGIELSHSLVFIPEQEDSYMFHTPNIQIAKLVSQCLALEPLEINVSGDEVEAVGKALKEVEEDYLITGAIASEYQKERFESAAYFAGKKCLFPLWKRNEIGLLTEICLAGMEVIFVGRFAEGLDDSWLGRRLDFEAINELARLQERYGINPSGEGGEYETLVIDAPFFGKRLRLEESKKISCRSSGRLEVRARVEEKSKEQDDCYWQKN